MGLTEGKSIPVIRATEMDVTEGKYTCNKSDRDGRDRR